MENCKDSTIVGRVVDSSDLEGPISYAEVYLYEDERGRGRASNKSHVEIEKTLTDAEGRFRFSKVTEEGASYSVEAHAFDVRCEPVPVKMGEKVVLHLKIDFKINTYKIVADGETPEGTDRGQVGRRILAVANSSVEKLIKDYEWNTPLGASVLKLPGREAEINFSRAGITRIEVWAIGPEHDSGKAPRLFIYKDFIVSEADVQTIGGKVGVSLERTAAHHTLDQALWVAIRNRTRAISFGPYREFIDRVLGMAEHESLGIPALDRRLKDLGTHMHGVGAYQLLKLATEVFLLLECGVRIEGGPGDRRPLFHPDDEAGRLGDHVTLEFANAKLREYLGSPPQLPYITRVIETAFPYLEREGLRCDRVVTARVNEPCLIELFWSYWHEEGMLVQTMKAISRRFQNVRGPDDRDPLAHLELDPLRPLGNILWGDIQDEINQLTVKRRAYEYSHHYGLMVYGRATGSLRPADNRSKFLEALHHLLYLCSVFFKEDNDTTVIADGYPLLNALKEVHLLLAQGAHNQFGDLPWTARAEMMLQQWILSRPEIRDFLQSRAMVPYKEGWMPQVDTMKTMQGWSDVTVTHFRDLGVYGEQILLSIRYGDWISLTDEDHAKNWARYWRSDIQAYLHAYRAVTGVDLTSSEVDATLPGIHLQRRLAIQQRAR
jgi:hypothetical protein